MKQKLPSLVFGVLSAIFFILTTPTAQANETIYVVGDSIAVGIVTTNRVASGGSWSNGGDNVTEVGRLVDRLIADRQIRGARVILSSGASNSTFQTRTMRDDLTEAEIAVIGRQIDRLKNAGATVYLVGTGSTISTEFPKTRYVDGPYQINFAQQQINQRLSALASSKGITFLGPLENYGLSSDKLHPSAAGYRALYNAVANGSGAASAPSQPPASDLSNFTQPRDPSLIQGVVSGRGLIPCGRSGEQGEDSQPCTACHAVLAGKTLLDYLTSIMTVIAVAVIVAMGVLYILSGVNTSLKETAKKGLWAVLVGLIFMLSAWLIVNTVLRFLASDDFQQGGGGFIGVKRGNGIFALECNTASDAGTAVMMQGGRVLNVGGSQGSGPGGSGAPGGTASCSAITDSNNACSVRTLSAGCFGANGEVMSRVCNLESANGTVGIRSGSDVCGNYERRSFSGGLFQINVFANGQHLGQECQNLGSKGSCVTRRGDVCVNWRCNIPDIARFDRCMQRTLTAEGNIQIACAISRNGQDRTPWACTANRCGVGGVLSSNPRVRNMCL